MIFLLVQIAMSSPDMPDKIGVSNPWSEYIKFVPAETSLPTFWTDAERQCLWGTSLENHLAAKIKALDSEFADFRKATESIEWCRRWWDPDPGCLSVEDWKTVDSIHRSRSMDFSQYGLCLVPVMDMANHDSLFSYKALYTIDKSTRDAQLTLEFGQSIEPGDEVTIMYGFERGAADSIFSYGFIEPGLYNAISIFLAIEPPANDPLALAKMAALDLEPGIKVSMLQSANRATWISGFVWAMCLNEEDGLNIQVVQTVEGKRELELSWKGTKIMGQEDLEMRLKADRLYNLFLLRGYSMVHERVETEVEARTQLHFRPKQDKLPEGIDASSRVWQLAEDLRRLEGLLLQKAVHDFYETVRCSLLIFQSRCSQTQIMHLTTTEEVDSWFKARAAEQNGDGVEYREDGGGLFSGSDSGDDEQWEEHARQFADDVAGATTVQDGSSPLPGWGSELDESEKDMRKLALLEKNHLPSETRHDPQDPHVPGTSAKVLDRGNQTQGRVQPTSTGAASPLTGTEGVEDFS